MSFLVKHRPVVISPPVPPPETTFIDLNEFGILEGQCRDAWTLRHSHKDETCLHHCIDRLQCEIPALQPYADRDLPDAQMALSWCEWWLQLILAAQAERRAHIEKARVAELITEHNAPSGLVFEATKKKIVREFCLGFAKHLTKTRDEGVMSPEVSNVLQCLSFELNRFAGKNS